MKRFIVSLIAVLAFATLVQAQAKAEGGYIMKSTLGAYSTYSTEQALNSVADWYTCKRADSIGVVVATKYGSTVRLKQIYNNSGSTQYIKVVFVNRLVSTVADTVTLNVPAYGLTGKLPSVLKVVSGAVVDSTVYYLQIN
jgi:hypothetical protein